MLAHDTALIRHQQPFSAVRQRRPSQEDERISIQAASCAARQLLPVEVRCYISCINAVLLLLTINTSENEVLHPLLLHLKGCFHQDRLRISRRACTELYVVERDSWNIYIYIYIYVVERYSWNYM